MNRLTTLFLLFFGLAPSAGAQTSVHGFGLERYDQESGVFAPHVRLIASQRLGTALEAKATVTPVGPLPFFSYYELAWQGPLAGIDQIEIGRLFPLFGRDWYDYRVDQVPMLTYSSIYGPLAAVDTGAAVSGHAGRLRWYVGYFLGNPLFGNMPRWHGADAYMRTEYGATTDLTLAISQRVGTVPASGGDVRYVRGRARFTLENVTSQGMAQESFQAEYRLTGPLLLAGRHEWLAQGNRFGLAATCSFGPHTELKVLAEDNPRHVVVQVAERF